jgi:hypothetical protein
MADRYGHRGFADATDADDADKAGNGHVVRYAQNVLIASDHVYDAAGQIGMRKICCNGFRGLNFIPGARNRRHETIASAGQCCDVPDTIFSIAKRLAGARHVKA